MIVLGIDTSEARGSVAVRKDGALAAMEEHVTSEDYSSWLLPAVGRTLGRAGSGLKDVDVFAVANGPGSFTGLRVGITAVKAWAELFEKSTIGVSRLEAIARVPQVEKGYVAASFDARRGQIFGGMYRVEAGGGLRRVELEMVAGAEEFVRRVSDRAGRDLVRWVTLDPELIEITADWMKRKELGETLELCEAGLASVVAELGEERARRGEANDAVHLDANYVRRSDAEIFWKDPASHGR